jgi:hypothetical protein
LLDAINTIQKSGYRKSIVVAEWSIGLYDSTLLKAAAEEVGLGGVPFAGNACSLSDLWR